MTISPLLILCATAVMGQSPEAVEALLKKPLLDPRQSQLEVQVYTGARVTPMPVFNSLTDWQNYSSRLRNQILNDVIFRGEAARWRDAATRIEWLPGESTGPGYRLRKLRFEAIPGMWLPALLYEPAGLTGRVPVVLNVNGHEREGTATPYIQTRCIHLARNGVLALNVEWFGKGQLDIPNLVHYRMQQVDLCGTSGVALFYLSLKRSLDIAESLEHADSSRIAVTGLSGGGWQTIFLSALDPRVRLANPVAGFSSYVTRTQFPEPDLGDSEQTPSDLASVADYTHLVGLMAPRPIQLAHNAKDNCCFRADYAISPLLQAGRGIYSLYGEPGRLRYHINYGDGHNYDADNREAFYRLLREFFFNGQAAALPPETDPLPPVRKSEELRVELPADNADFNSIALALSRSLPRPVQGYPLRRLREIVRAKDYAVTAFAAGTEERDGLRAAYWRLRMDDSWTVPAVELTRGASQSTVLLVADGGRAATAREAAQLLAEGKRVLAIDPFYFGESKIATRDFLFAMLVAGIGDRPLGIQASQLAAVARWRGPLSVHAIGPRSSLFALIAAALEPGAITSLDMRDSFGSLKEILTQNRSVEKEPELFCFGLLESFDIPQLLALVAPRPVTGTK